MSEQGQGFSLNNFKDFELKESGSREASSDVVGAGWMNGGVRRVSTVENNTNMPSQVVNQGTSVVSGTSGENPAKNIVNNGQDISAGTATITNSGVANGAVTGSQGGSDNIAGTNVIKQPVLPDDGKSISIDEQGDTPPDTGNGVIIDNPQEVPKDQQGIKITKGVTADVMDRVNKTLEGMDSQISEVKAKADEIKKTQPKSLQPSEDDDDEAIDPEELKKDYAEAIVIIDKTGMGAVNFTDEERAKLEKTKKIKLEEVETISLETIKTKRAKKKDVDKILAQQPAMHATSIILPASGYTAQIRGCSTYELVGFFNNTGNTMNDTISKWKLIHSKIESTSLGDMDFETFLKSTASIDYNVFIYGIICATYPDDDVMPMECKQDKCNKPFDHKYTVKSLIRAEKMTEVMKATVANIVNNSFTLETAKACHESAALSINKSFKLPVSGFIVKLYIQSAYDFIYRSLQGLDKITDARYNQSAVLSSVVDVLYVPDSDAPGEYFEFTSSEAIAKTIYTLGDTDILVLTKQSDLVLENLSFEFGFMDVKCPNCGHYTPTIPVDLDSILFYKYQQALNTKIE